MNNKGRGLGDLLLGLTCLGLFFYGSCTAASKVLNYGSTTLTEAAKTAYEKICDINECTEEIKAGHVGAAMGVRKWEIEQNNKLSRVTIFNKGNKKKLNTLSAESIATTAGHKTQKRLHETNK